MTNIILELVPRNKLGTYMGFANLILIVAPALGPTFGGAVVSLASWRMIFWITLPIAIIFLILGMIAIEQYTPTEKYPFDWLRFGLLSVTMVMLLVAMNALTLPNGIQRFGSDIMITAVALTLFIWRSKYSIGSYLT